MNMLSLQNLSSGEILKVIEDYMWKARLACVENFDFPQYKRHRKSIIKSEVLEQFGEKV